MSSLGNYNCTLYVALHVWKSPANGETRGFSSKYSTSSDSTHIFIRIVNCLPLVSSMVGLFWTNYFITIIVTRISELQISRLARLFRTHFYRTQYLQRSRTQRRLHLISWESVLGTIVLRTILKIVFQK
jgi:hypothetical protein